MSELEVLNEKINKLIELNKKIIIEISAMDISTIEKRDELLNELNNI